MLDENILLRVVVKKSGLSYPAHKKIEKTHKNRDVRVPLKIKTGHEKVY